ncbi:MAG: HAD-IC family P-type ATPase [Bradyrhizobiaceae bacterium]|nr:HAD-IC family P-type ATPase [Bradyrhizobiaceae bacterium]
MLHGLSSAEALRRLASYGPNATPDSDVHPLRLLLRKFMAPVPCLLEAAIVLQLVLGEYAEAAIIAVLLVFNAALGLFHEGRAQATVKALKSRLALSAAVRRDGTWTIVPAADVVPGDIVKLSLGTVVVADVRLLDGAVLLDQAMLTGESLPIEAGPGQAAFAGALVRRGEAAAEVTATGTRTKFGRTAELVRTAHAVSSEQTAVFRLVRNLALFNGAVTLALIAYSYHLGMNPAELLALMLVAVLGSIPVALPATFTLATAIGAQALAKSGVLPTRLSAVDEAASMDVLCADKTGTLTRNELTVGTVSAMAGFDPARVLALAALASSEGGQDPVDTAVRNAAAQAGAVADLPTLVRFVPFDPAVKMSEAIARERAGATIRIVKGAYAVIAALTPASSPQAGAAAALEAQGYRVLGVAAGPPGSLQLAGLIPLGDPPRGDAAPCIAALGNMGVRTVMVTGDARDTAAAVAQAVGLDGAVYSGGAVTEAIRADDFAVFAGVLPEDKYHLVKSLQNRGHVTGMCGDGANDAPALRQAQIGIAVSTATDVARSAAGIVLTEAGLAGIVAAVREGRITFQRILTYTLRSIVHKTRQVLFLAIGLGMTGHAILTPMLMVMSMITGDLLAMSSTTDNVRPSARPNAWRIDSLTIAGIVIGLCDLAFCVASLAAGKFYLGLDIDRLRTLTLVTLQFNGQAVFYVVRERRRLWSSAPSTIVIASSLADITIIPTMAVLGILMAPLPLPVVLALFAAALALAFVLDQVKVALFRWLGMA